MLMFSFTISVEVTEMKILRVTVYKVIVSPGRLCKLSRYTYDNTYIHAYKRTLSYYWKCFVVTISSIDTVNFEVY